MNYEDRVQVKVARDLDARRREGLKPREAYRDRYSKTQSAEYRQGVYERRRERELVAQGLREVGNRFICNHCGKESGKFRPARHRHEEGCIHAIVHA